MVEEAAAQESVLTFETDGYPGELRVLQLSGHEGISDLFSFRVDLATQDAEVDLDAVVGSRGQLGIHHADGTRFVYGIVSRIEQGTVGETFTSYYAELVPSVWLLTQRYQSRIFQTMTVRDIIEKVLAEAGVASDEFRFALQRSNYARRDYCVQYRETHWNFIARLMEEEGIFFFFEHADGKDVLVMADAADVHVPIDGTADVLFREPTGLVETEEFIFDFRFSQQIRPGAAALRDFNFEKPKVDLTKDDSASRDTELEVYDFPGIYTEDAVGTDLARLRLEALQARRQEAQGQSVCRRMIPGYMFTMQEHPRESFNIEHLITWVQHEGTQPLGQDEAGGRFHYGNTFRAIPADVPFRPTRTTPKPVVEGVQTAIVVGPSGEEIYTDKYGRVKVQFHWDREGVNDENSSCWIRVSQLWAGASWGAMFIPRLGHEVIVDFIEGDPDRPIITGRVYNADNMPPYGLDGEKTKSTVKSDSTKGGGGSNEYRFEDKKGSEEIYQHAQKDLTIATENDKNQTTGHDETLSIGNDRTKTVGNDEKSDIGNNRTETVGTDETITIGSNRTEKVGSNETITIGADRTENVGSNESITIGADRTENVGGNETITIGGKETESIGGDHSLTVGASQSVNIGAGQSIAVGKNISVTAGSSMSLNVGKNYSVLAGASIVLKAGKDITIVCGGASMKLKSDGTIQISGKDIKLKASGKILAKASGAVTLKGSKILEN
ncbi:MAG TPA: type VI secretion system tip protein TssI/VgrG [Acidobacteriota bacterium]|nr:type VI secretion system tip protein TssI/VgrG [Acidobacteriota bacterium]